MQKKLEEEVRLVLELAVKDFGLNPDAIETIIASRGYTREKSTKPKVITEDLGKIFEMAICLVYGIPFIGKYKYAMEEAQELKEKITINAKSGKKKYDKLNLKEKLVKFKKSKSLTEFMEK